MSFTQEELQQYRGKSMSDLYDEHCRLLIVGINPSLWSAAVDAPFARPGNRFWPALHRTRIVPSLVDARNGLSDHDRRMILARQVGVTNLVNRATARASELNSSELRAGLDALHDIVIQAKPAVVAVCGITAYRQAFNDPRATIGRQQTQFANTPVWVVPNPSGLNAHETLGSLAQAYAEPAREAGIVDS